MARDAGKLRLFVAAFPSGAAVDALLTHVRRLDLPAHRETPAQQVHLTAHFIGPWPANRVDDAAESVARATSGLPPVRTHATRLATLPKRGRPQLIAAELAPHSTLLETHARLVRSFARRARPDPNDRFLPHLTLLRFARGVETESIDRSLADESIEIAFDELRLVRSVLRPEGPEYRVLMSAPFTGRVK